MSDLPAGWAMGSERLRAVLAALWDRLPDPERGLLAYVVRDVTNGPTPSGGLGACGDLETSGLTVRVWIDAARVIDDRALVWVCAHELAHASLRHAALDFIAAALITNSPDWGAEESQTLRVLQEFEADLLAGVGWGLGNELDAFLAEFPAQRRLRVGGEAGE